MQEGVRFILARRIKKDKRFKTFWYHRKPAYWLYRHRPRPPGARARPEVVRFDAAPGVQPSLKPPVRIFLGTEAAQYRATRAFIWSIKKVRDPSRIYEIYLMNDLKGFDRTKWKTGFTNYRYAIPALAGGTGRAIYNDVDQVYLADPAELFDLDMDGAGVLSVYDWENAVMLIDCDIMSRHWRIEDVHSDKKHKYFLGIVHKEQLWKPLLGVWNTRDCEYPVAQTKCLHYTTLHTQPWHPFPKQLRYFPHAEGAVWYSLEREADEAGFLLFEKDAPSRRFGELIMQYQMMHDGRDEEGKATDSPFDGRRMPKSTPAIADLIRETGAKTVLDYGAGQGSFYESYPGEPAGSRIKSLSAWPGVKVICYDPGYEPFSEPYEQAVDGVISTDVIEHIPEEDVPWVLDDLFGKARKFVYVLAACYPANAILPNGENAHCTVQSPEWWRDQMALIARRFPGIDWALASDEKGRFGKKRRLFKSAGASAGGA